MFPLSCLPLGKSARILSLSAREPLLGRLMDLGFVPGAEVSVVSAPGDGNVIVNLKGAKLAITSQMATRIMVQ